jgi:hypothetical protein
MIKRAIVLLGPVIGFVFYFVFIGNGKATRTWAPWVFAAYFVLALLISAAFPRRLTKIGNSGYLADLQGKTQMVWKVMLFFYVFAFLAGLVLAIALRNTFPLLYLVIPLGLNLVFILLFCWILFWRGSPKFPN